MELANKDQLVKDINSVIDKITPSRRWGINYVLQDHHQKIEQWLSFYRGNINGFQVYHRVINGVTKTFERPSLQLGKLIADQRASLIFSEDFGIIVNDEDKQKELDKVLNHNNFYTEFPKFWTRVGAYTGYGIMIEFEDEYGNIQIDMIDGRSSYIIHSNGSRITGTLTLSLYKDIVKGKEVFYRLMTFHYIDGNDYIIKNQLYKSDSNNTLGEEVDLEEFEDTRELASEVVYKNRCPRFQVITPAGTNNHNVDAPYPVPFIANCTDIIKNADKNYDLMNKEIEMKRARVVISKDALKADIKPVQGAKEGEVKSTMVEYFDPNEEIYQAISLKQDTMKDPIKEINTGDMRIQSYEKAHNIHMDNLAIAVGLGAGWFSNENSSSRVTATAVISQKSEAYATKMADERLIRIELQKMVDAIGDILNIDFGDIEVSFNDNLLETDQQKFEKHKLLLDTKCIPRYWILMKTLNIGEDEAKELVKKAAEEETELESIYINSPSNETKSNDLQNTIGGSAPGFAAQTRPPIKP